MTGQSAEDGDFFPGLECEGKRQSPICGWSKVQQAG